MQTILSLAPYFIGLALFFWLGPRLYINTDWLDICYAGRFFWLPAKAALDRNGKAKQFNCFFWHFSIWRIRQRTPLQKLHDWLVFAFIATMIITVYSALGATAGKVVSIFLQ